MTDNKETGKLNDKLTEMNLSVTNARCNYPHKFHVIDSIESMINKAEATSCGEITANIVQSAGRVTVIKSFGKLFFYKTLIDGLTIQLVANFKLIKDNDIKSICKTVGRGDIIGFTGNIGKTKTGERSVFITKLTILSACLHNLPCEYFGINDPEIIYRQRYLDLILNNESRNRFITRSKIINYIRRFLLERGYMEVETPIMDVSIGGAAAKPFRTHHNELKQDLFLRVSPELYLKKCIVGGLDKVFEIGKQFRNEGIDLTHNPEFTSCEFYEAFADYNDLLIITEELISGMVMELFGTYTINYSPKKWSNEHSKGVTIDFRPPFKKINMLETLSTETGIKVTGANIESEEIFKMLVDHMKEKNIIMSSPFTLTRVLDKLVGHYIEPKCINPTFIMNHPTIMSPLAKVHRSLPGLTERFELFLHGAEVINAYTELNDPFDQRRRFDEQMKDLKAGDEEAMLKDESFCVALEYGLPPTGGWGLGIDRLVMYLTNAANIRDVVIFPCLKSEKK